jgi:hypothetical protein
MSDETTARWWVMTREVFTDQLARRTWISQIRAHHPQGRLRFRPVLLVELRVPTPPIQLDDAVPSEACTHNIATQGGNE